MLELETELLRIKRNGASHIGYLVADAVDALDERVCVYARGGSVWHATLLPVHAVGNERLFCARVAKTEPLYSRVTPRLVSRLLPDNFVVAAPCSLANDPSRRCLERPSLSSKRPFVYATAPRGIGTPAASSRNHKHRTVNKPPTQLGDTLLPLLLALLLCSAELDAGVGARRRRRVAGRLNLERIHHQSGEIV